MGKTSDKSTTSDAKAVQRLIATAQEQGRADPYSGKRRCKRFAIGVPLEVTTNPDHPAAAFHAVMQNVSEGGFAFWSKHELDVHAAILIREFAEEGEGEWLAARVRHCTVGLRGFLVGAEFEPIAD